MITNHVQEKSTVPNKIAAFMSQRNTVAYIVEHTCKVSRDVNKMLRSETKMRLRLMILRPRRVSVLLNFLETEMTTRPFYPGPRPRSRCSRPRRFSRPYIQVHCMCVSMLRWRWPVQFRHFSLLTWTNITKVLGIIRNSLTAIFNNQLDQMSVLHWCQKRRTVSRPRH